MRRPDVPVGRRPPGHAATRPPRFRVGPPKPPFSLSNWPVSRRLSAVIVIAVALGVVFGGLRITAATDTAIGFARTTQLALLGEEATTLAQAMEDERDLTAAVCAASPGGQCPTVGERVDGTARSLQAEVRRAQAATNATARRVQTLAAQIGSPFPSNTQAKAAAVIAMLGNFASLRTRGVTQPPQAVIVAYTEAIGSLFALCDEITSASGDSLLSDEVRTLGSLSRAKDEASQERAILDAALIEDSFNNVPAALATAQGLEDTDLAAFVSSATQAEENDYLNTVDVERFDTEEMLTNFLFLNAVSDPKLPPAQAFALAFSNALFTHQSVTTPPKSDVWYSTMTDTITRMRTVEQRLAAAIVARSQSLEQGARESAVLTSAVTGALLLFVLILTFVLTRSLVHPLRRLQADALEIATVQLPARVAALSEATDPNVTLEVEPISVHSTDEIGKVARAFDRVHGEAVRLAGNEALLRSSLSSMFINLSRRSVPLIERLARKIDSLEQNEDDPGRLSSLFSMDHLVTRMRRNSENLLVLAGEEPVRKWREPVPLSDVARAATSEIEQYTRVVLDIQPQVTVSGQAASDVVHLLAEIIENATRFSPRETPVHVSGHECSSGGVLLKVLDNGVGLSATRLAEMNDRLDTPPEIDVSVSRHMGLFAVSRLAARHGVKVRLRTVSPQGLSALVWLPGSLTGREAARQGGPWSRQPASQAAAAQLTGGGLQVPGRRSFVLLADPQQDDSTDGHHASGPMTATAPAAAPSNWFRAEPPSSASAEAAFAGEVDSGSSTRTGTGSPGDGETASGSAWAGGLQTTETVGAPVLGNQTAAGLPSRIPGANLSSGLAASAASKALGPGETPPVSPRQPSSGKEKAAPAPPRSLPRRSAQQARNRLGGFQLGGRLAEDRASSEGEGS
jgi:signal transduction histidine kinase